jgi:hypothetical protein
MNLERLEKYIDTNNFNLGFETDGVGMTWGVSYIRFTVGDKSKFDSIEHFFFSTLKSDKNQTSGIYGQPTWTDRTNLKEWAKNLKIKEVKNEELTQFIIASIKDIEENLKYWIKENSIDSSVLNASKKYGKCLLVNETISPRHYINSTDTYLTDDETKYYCFEGHWES